MHRLALVVIAGSLLACTREIPTASLVIEGVNIIDVRDGSVAENMTLALDGDRIRAVGRTGRFRVPDGTPVVDATGKYAIPGLWDMHVHALWDGPSDFRRGRYQSLLMLFVAHGITGFRDTWGDLELAERLRAERASGDGLVPRFILAGNLVDGYPPIWPASTGSISAATPEDGRRVVDSLVAAQAGFIKVYSRLSAEAFHAIADQAKRAGIRFAGHVPASVRAADAAETGQWTIEHLFGLENGCSSAEDELISAWVAWRAAQAAGDSSVSGLERNRRANRLILSTQDTVQCNELMQVLVQNQTWIVPTLIALRGQAYINDPQLAKDPRMRYLLPGLRDFWDPKWTQDRMEEDWRLEREMLALALQLTRRAHRAGVGILAGSDTPNPHVFPGSGLHDELALLVEAGLTPLEALQAATLHPARFLAAQDSLGTLERGKLADIVILDANPLEDIQNIREIHAVTLAGKLLLRSDLDALLTEAEAMASH